MRVISPFTSPLYALFQNRTGVALITLLVNGSLAAPLLRKLGLADSPEKRKRIVQGFERLLIDHQVQTLKDLVENDDILCKVNLDVVVNHVELLKKFSLADLQEYIGPTGVDETATSSRSALPRRAGASSDVFRPVDTETEELLKSLAFENENDNGDETDLDEEMLKEQRKLYLGVLRVAYEKQCASGELDVRKDFIAFMLLQSVVYSEDLVTQGEPLHDWKVLNDRSVPLASRVGKAAKECQSKCMKKKGGEKERRNRNPVDFFEGSLENADDTVRVYQAIAFVRAHTEADRVYREASATSGEGALESKRVLHESEATVLQAKKFLSSVDDIEQIASLLTCKILLHATSEYILHLTEEGFLKEQEAEEYVHQHIIKQLKEVDGKIKY